MSNMLRTQTKINAEKNLVRRIAFQKCHKMLAQAEALSKKHNFELTCAFGDDGWNSEYMNLDTKNSDNSLQSIMYALIAIEFYHENIMDVEDVNDVVDQTIVGLKGFMEDKLNEYKKNN